MSVFWCFSSNYNLKLHSKQWEQTLGHQLNAMSSEMSHNIYLKQSKLQAWIKTQAFLKHRIKLKAQISFKKESFLLSDCIEKIKTLS